MRVLHGYTRSDAGDLVGRFGAEHLAAAMPSPDAVFVCGPAALVDAVREHCENVHTESFVPPVFEPSANPSGGRITFSDSGIDAVDDGRSLLEQAESAGLTPQNGCRMGICHTCTRRKTAGTVRNLTTGAVSTGPDEDVQICVSVPVGNVELSLTRLEGGKAMSNNTITLTPEQADAFGRELDAIKERVMADLGEEGRRLHPPRHQNPARAGSRRTRAVVPAAGLAAGHRDAGHRENPGQHGDRAQHHARSVRLDA